MSNKIKKTGTVMPAKKKAIKIRQIKTGKNTPIPAPCCIVPQKPV